MITAVPAGAWIEVLPKGRYTANTVFTTTDHNKHTTVASVIVRSGHHPHIVSPTSSLWNVHPPEDLLSRANSSRIPVLGLHSLLDMAHPVELRLRSSRILYALGYCSSSLEIRREAYSTITRCSVAASRTTTTIMSTATMPPLPLCDLDTCGSWCQLRRRLQQDERACTGHGSSRRAVPTRETI